MVKPVKFSARSFFDPIAVLNFKPRRSGEGNAFFSNQETESKESREGSRIFFLTPCSGVL
jgi:hypothetical protein